MYDQQTSKNPAGSPPPYESVTPGYAAVSTPHELQAGRRVAQTPATPAEYAKALVMMQKSLKNKAKRDNDTSRRLRVVRDLDGAHDIIADSLLTMLGVLPESEVTVIDSAPEILAAYQMDSMSAMRIAAWARQNFHVELTTRDLVAEEVQTLDDAALVVASRYMVSASRIVG